MLGDQTLQEGLREGRGCGRGGARRPASCSLFGTLSWLVWQGLQGHNTG